MKRLIVENGKRKIINKKSIKELINTKGFIRLCGAHNAISAKIIEDHGFEALWLSSFEMHASNRLPDADILNVSDYANAVSKITDRVNIPLVVDGDCGGGSPINTIRMVREYEKAGASGICIEDNLYPKRCSFYSGVSRSLESPSGHASKIKAAIENRMSNDFMVIARTESLIAGHGMAEAYSRAEMYVDAGADAVLIHSKINTPDEIFEFCKTFKEAPVFVVPTKYPQVKEKELIDNGISGVIYANAGLRATIRVLNMVYKILDCEATLKSVDNILTSLPEVYDLVGLEDLRENERRYSA